MCSHRVSRVSIPRMLFGIPAAVRYALNEFLRDSISFDRKRVVRIRFVSFIDRFHIRRMVGGQSRCNRKMVDNFPSHLRPHEL